MSNGSKKCSKCGQTKSLDDYYADNRSKSGRQSQCKKCMKEWRVANRDKAAAAARRYRERHPDLVRERARIYRQQNPEKVAESLRKWRAQNRQYTRLYAQMYHRENVERRREYSRERRRRNPELVRRAKRRWRRRNIEAALEMERERSRRWRRKNPEKGREKQRKYQAAARLADPQKAREKSRQSKQRWRARKRNGVSYRITSRDLRKIKQRHCVACGSAADSLDHVIPLSRGGTHGIGNLAAMCRNCNSSKGARTITEWRKANDWLPLGSFPRRKDRADGAA